MTISRLLGPYPTCDGRQLVDDFRVADHSPRTPDRLRCLVISSRLTQRALPKRQPFDPLATK